MRNRNFSGGFREPSGSWEANHEERMRKMEQEKMEKLKNPYIFLDDAIRDVAAKTEARQKIEMFISSLPAELPETLRQDILRTRIGIELINGDYFFTSFAHEAGLADAWGLDSSRVVSRDHDVTGMRKDRPPRKKYDIDAFEKNIYHLMLGVKKNPQILESLKGIAVNLVHLSKETIEELVLVLPKLQEIQPQTNMSDEKLKEAMVKLISKPSRLAPLRTIFFILSAADSVPLIKKFALQTLELDRTVLGNGFESSAYLSKDQIKTETWQYVIDYVKNLKPEAQDKVFRRMFRDFAHVEERLNKHKDYFAAWEQEGVPYEEYIVKHHEQELKKMDVAIISAEKVGKSWTGWGNTYASETYGLNTEAVLAVERGEDIFMQFATYYEKGVRKGEVRMIEVDKKLQSTLVASRLVEWAQKMLIEAGAEELVIKTAKPNVIKYAARKNYVFSHKENFGRSVLSVFIKKVDD